MMAALILVLSLAALLQFFVSYCRSLIATSSKEVLSPEVQDVSGLRKGTSGEDFARVIQLLHLCPERREDRSGVQAIGTYFSILGFLRATIGQLAPSLLVWTERERGQCTYFAAVALDRRIAFSKNMLAERMDT